MKITSTTRKYGIAFGAIPATLLLIKGWVYFSMIILGVVNYDFSINNVSFDINYPGWSMFYPISYIGGVIGAIGLWLVFTLPSIKIINVIILRRMLQIGLISGICALVITLWGSAVILPYIITSQEIMLELIVLLPLFASSLITTKNILYNR